MNATRQAFSSMFANKRLFSQAATYQMPLRPIPAMYNKRTTFDTVKLALLNPNDPRTFPRFIVSSTVVTFFTLMTVNFLLYRKDHFKAEHKNNPLAAHLTERPTRVTKALSQGPIVVNARRYDTLKKEGLGVDHEEWLKRKYTEQG